MTRLALLVALALTLSACALTSKGEAVEVHWYTPMLVQPGSSVPPPDGRPLHLGFVTSGTELEERISYGDGEFRTGYYEDRRWTARPARFVTDALRRALFEGHGFQPGGGDAPHLDVQLLAFEEIRTPQTHSGRVALHYQLATDHVLLDDTIATAEPVLGPRFDDVVAALSKALDVTADEVAQRVQAALAGTP